MEHFKSSLEKIRNNYPEYFSELNSKPTIICDIKIGNDLHTTRFFPPCKSRVITLVNPQGSSEEDIYNKLIAWAFMGVQSNNQM
jgi:hypothetical protein